MRIKQIIVTLLFVAVVISCKNKAKDIDVSEIKTACELVDYYILIMDEMLAIEEAIDSDVLANQWDNVKIKELETLSALLRNVPTEDIEVDREKSKACPNFDMVLEKMKKLDKLESKLNLDLI
tara:strand:- start:221 stop:589 length:369 start_codon:yes stop_codon:yes gene_type:complete